MTVIITAYIIIISIFSFLLLTWTLNIPINVNKYQIQQEPLLIILGYLLLIIPYFRQHKKLYDVIFRYQDFLVENGLNIKKYNKSKLLYIYTKNLIWFSSNEVRIFKLLFEVGLESLKLNNFVDKTDYGLISIALFSREQSSLRSYTCREISKNNKSVMLVFAYLDLSSDKKTHHTSKSGTRHVSLTDLYNSAEHRLNLRISELGEGVNRELAHLETLLSEGIWPSSLSTFLNVVYTPEAPSSSENKFLKIQKEKPWIQNALKEVFMRLSIPAIERYISSKKPNAYLLTFDSPTRGNIALHINNLSALKSEIFQWTNYTKNARIGLLPKSFDFFEFAEKVKIELIEDLKKAVSPPIKTELILHRLGLSGLDHYEVKIPGVTERKAIIKLQRVIARSSDSMELLTILKYNRLVGSLGFSISLKKATPKSYFLML